MLGRQHLVLSSGTVLPVLLPFIQQADIFIAALAGTCIGSLIPDIDAHDAAIFHRKIRGLRHGTGTAFNGVIGPFLPVFGYITKFLVFLPAVKALNMLPTGYSFDREHRHFTHSVFGVTMMTAVTGVYISALLLFLDVDLTWHVPVFLSFYALGAFLHLLQDSCTRTGVRWNSPFSETKLHGKLVTGRDNLKPRIFGLYLGLISLMTIYFSFSGSLRTYFLYAITAMSWIIFVYSCEVSIEK